MLKYGQFSVQNELNIVLLLGVRDLLVTFYWRWVYIWEILFSSAVIDSKETAQLPKHYKMTAIAVLVYYLVTLEHFILFMYVSEFVA